MRVGPGALAYSQARRASHRADVEARVLEVRTIERFHNAQHRHRLRLLSRAIAVPDTTAYQTPGEPIHDRRMRLASLYAAPAMQ